MLRKRDGLLQLHWIQSAHLFFLWDALTFDDIASLKEIRKEDANDYKAKVKADDATRAAEVAAGMKWKRRSSTDKLKHEERTNAKYKEMLKVEIYMTPQGSGSKIKI